MSGDRSATGGLLSSVRVRATLVLVVLAVLVLAVDLTTPTLVVALLMGGMALAVVLVPALQATWVFNVLVGVGVALYGVAYALGQGTTFGWGYAVVMVVIGLALAATHLGVAPWSSRPRRV